MLSQEEEGGLDQRVGEGANVVWLLFMIKGDSGSARA
jgi:hypothetical protein